jgi:copper transport protein
LNLESLAAIAKLLTYVGVSVGAGVALAWASLGATLAGIEPAAPRLVRWGATTAGLATLAGIVVLLAQIGGFDGATLGAVLAGSTGLAAGLRIAGAALLLAAASGGARRRMRVAGGVALVLSFGVTGHATSVGLATGVLAAAHVAAASWWLGGLLLLLGACGSLPDDALVRLVRRFSRIALRVVGGLTLSGTVLVLVLVRPAWQAWLAPYGQNLAVKLALGSGALAIAAHNRTRLLPRLANGVAGAPRALHRTLTLEFAVLVGVLAATAWLTTFHSPHGDH